MTRSVTTVLTVLTFATAAHAQEVLYTPRLHFAGYAGASIPTGTLRDDFDTGVLLGAQTTYDLGTHVGVLGSFDWSHPTTRLVASDASTNVYQANLGLELGGARGNMSHWAVRPFMDVGGGVRRYTYASTDLTNRTSGLGFAALGTELAVGRSSLRLAASDNLVSYESPLINTTRSTRNDVGLTLGFTFHP